MSTTEQQYPDFSDYTFEKVWAVIQESHQRSEQAHQRWEQKIEQERLIRDQEHQKFMLELQKVSEQQKETDRKMQETDRKMQETDQKMKETDRQLGRLGNRLGEFMESVIRPGVAKKFNELGYSFDGESRNLIIKDPITKQRQTELDVILENGDSVVVVEVKLNPCIEDIKHFDQQLQYYRAYRNRNNPNDSKKIFGAMAATVFPDDVQQFALDSGYYVIVPSGESIQIVVPKTGELKVF